MASLNMKPIAVPTTRNAKMPRLNRDTAESLDGKNTTAACEIKMDAVGRKAPQFPVAQNGQCGAPAV